MTTATCVTGLLVIVLHEVGHLSAATALGINVKRIGVSWKGMYIVREAGTRRANLITTLAGPFINLLFAAAWSSSHEFALVNLIFGLSNLVPLAGSDGQRAWRLLAHPLSQYSAPTALTESRILARVPYESPSHW
jgi:Zn-dependent protease